MKRRTPWWKKKAELVENDTFFLGMMNEIYPDLAKEMQQEYETYESPFGQIDIIPIDPALPTHLSTKKKFNLPINRYGVKVRRKNGRVETYILHSDGSMNMGKIEWPDVELKKGDKVFTEDFKP